MFYPNAQRIEDAQFKQFYLCQIRPQLPEPKAMSNNSPKTSLGIPFDAELDALIAENTNNGMLLTLR